ncbi:Uncharacterized protein TCM_021009 [Theobroma cacao]|uniref:Uncharacterized protein n=1 Tax=Theobroma cacao TaxID=3641 RepID=A0A061EMZ5_THECC|nr:Uncharacterized protein TCM_021009 [Theobroma cacao]
MLLTARIQQSEGRLKSSPWLPTLALPATARSQLSTRRLTQICPFSKKGRASGSSNTGKNRKRIGLGWGSQKLPRIDL